jgi:hypothetical protein
MKNLKELSKLKADIINSDYPIEYKEAALHDVQYKIHQEEEKEISKVLYLMRVTLWIFFIFCLGILSLAVYLS